MRSGFMRTLSVVVFFFASSAIAQNCTNANYSGAYFFLQQGTALNMGAQVAYASLGKLTADGKGGVSGSGTEHIGNSTIRTFTFTGTYAVNPDCSGTRSLTVTPAGGPSNSSTGFFQLVSGGREVNSVTTDSGLVATSVAYRALSQCNAASLSGRFAGSRMSEDYTQKDVFGSVLTVAFDGQGGVTLLSGATNSLNSGVTLATTGKGTYSINADCTGSTALNGGTTAFEVAAGGRFLDLDTSSGDPPLAGVFQGLGLVTIIPHIAVNGGWNTDLIFVNSGEEAVTAQVSFLDGNGKPWQLTILPEGVADPILTTTMSITVPAHSRTVLHALGDPGVAAVGGWAKVSGTGPLTAYTVFGWPLNGQASNGITQAVSFSACGGASITVPFDNSNGRYFGFAVVNSGNTAATVQLTVTDPNGTQSPPSTLPAPLAAGGHTQFLLSGVAPVTDPAHGGSVLAGTVTLTSSAGSLAITPLQFNSNGSFTSVPVPCQ